MRPMKRMTTRAGAALGLALVLALPWGCDSSGDGGMPPGTPGTIDTSPCAGLYRVLHLTATSAAHDATWRFVVMRSWWCPSSCKKMWSSW